MMSKSKILLSFIHFFYFLAFFTSSFDIFLVLNIGGFNFRISQLFMLVPFITGISIFLVSSQKLILPLGIKWLLLWFVFILIFVPNTTYLQNSIGYGFWLLFNILTVIITPQLFKTYNDIIKLVRYYIYSFFFVACFGLLQFVLPILHLGAPLVEQWLVPGLIPRINAFSYEPSFFTTYMIMGWVLCAYLIKTNSSFLIPIRKLKFIFLTETVVIILSSSRIGILMIILWYLQYPISTLSQVMRGKLKIKSFQYSLLLLALLSITGYIVSNLGTDIINTILVGTGLADTAAHSVTERQMGATRVWEVFINSPIIGYSLGGVPIAIGRLNVVDVNNMDLVKEYTGINVTLEVLAASGIVGFIPFVLYISSLVFFPLRLFQRLKFLPERHMLLALEAAFIFELIILQFNQNILRPYFWFHIAIFSTVYQMLKQKGREFSSLKQIAL